MPRAIVLTTASKASLTGGTFADTLTADAGDALSVANFDQGQAWIREMWGIDHASVAEVSLVYTRPQATHDQSRGFRVQIPSLTPGGAGNVAAHNLLPGYAGIRLFPSDTPTISVSGTAADAVVVSWLTEYDDLPGASAVFATPDQVSAMRVSDVGISVLAVGAGTRGAYGATRAINADDDRLHADTWYAIYGASVQTPVTTIGLIGPDWGGQRIGMPAGALDLRSNTWFLDQSVKWGRPMIPCFNSNNKGNVLVTVADAGVSVSPKIDFFLVELSGRPGV